MTITGLDVSGWSGSENNKTIEAVGDNFTLKYSALHGMDGAAALYFDDNHYNSGTDTSHLQSYRVEANLLDGGGIDADGIRFSSGAGWSGDVANRVITGNTFSNVIDGIAFVGPGGDSWDEYPVGAATITDNDFTAADRRQVVAWGEYEAALGYGTIDWQGILDHNTFDKAVTVWTPGDVLRTWDCAGCGSSGDILNIGGIYSSIQRYAIDRVAQAGDTIKVEAGTYTEPTTTTQIVINKNLTIVGVDKATTIIKPAQDTSGTGNAGSWFLVNDGVTFNLSKVTLDGVGRNIRQGIRFNGSGVVDDVIIQNMTYPGYSGFGIAQGFENTGARTLTVSNSTFTNYGRIGVQADDGTGTSTVMITGNTFTGKGDGDHLDYGVTVEGGAHATITGNTFTNNRGLPAQIVRHRAAWRQARTSLPELPRPSRATLSLETRTP